MQTSVLVGIMSAILYADDMVRADELAKKFEISTRTVYRYVCMLSEGGFPVESHVGRGGGWKVAGGYKFKPAYFTPEEYERIVFGLQSSSVQDDVSRKTLSKVQEMSSIRRGVAYLKDDQFVVDGGDSALGERIKLISDCITKKRICRFEYHAKNGEVSVRAVEPYCLILKNGAWYMYGFCRLRRDFRYFKLVRIVNVEVGERFVARNYEPVDGSAIAEVLKDKEMCDVLLSVEKGARSACEEWLGVSSVAKLGENYVAKATLPYDEMLVDKILSLGVGVRVEKPQRLRQAVVERCRQIAEVNRDE